MKEKILLVEDDTEFLNLTRTWLQNAGYEVFTAGDGVEGMRRVYSCRRIRDMSDIPVLMVTVNGQKSDRLKGFTLGADDYITKPVDFHELIARVQAVLRRAESTKQENRPSTFDNGEIEIDWGS